MRKLTTPGKGLKRLISILRAPADLVELSNEVEALRGPLLVVQLSLQKICGRISRQRGEEELFTLLRATEDVACELKSEVEYQLKRRSDWVESEFDHFPQSAWVKSEPTIDYFRHRIRHIRGVLAARLSAINLQIG